MEGEDTRTEVRVGGNYPGGCERTTNEGSCCPGQASLRATKMSTRAAGFRSAYPLRVGDHII